MRERLPSGVVGYLLAVVATAAAIVVRWLLDPWLGHRIPFVTLYAAVAITVWFGGWRPALLAALVGYFASDYLFVEPRRIVGLRDAADVVGLLAYLLSCSIIIGIGEAMRAAEARATERREMLRITLASIGDAVVTTDLEGQVLYINAVAESLTGWTQEEAARQPVESVVHIVHELTRQRADNPAMRALREGAVVQLSSPSILIAKDGGERPISDRATPIRDARGRLAGCVLVFRDMTESKRAEGRRAARLAVTQVLAESATVAEAALRLLQSVCEGLKWDVGALWRVDHAAGVLRCVEVWRQPAARVAEFEKITRERAFERGIGLPGRVWADGKPAWIPDVVEDANFPRAPIANREGLHAAFGFPVMLGAEILGMIEFFSREIREPDADLLEMMTTIGGQVGQFMERRRAEQALHETEERFSRFMQYLPGLAWIKDVQGRYVYANDAAVAAFRTSRDQLYQKTDDDVFPADVAAQFKENDQRALASGAGVQAVETLEHEDGVVHHSIVNKFPIPGPDGKTALVGGIAFDITELKRAEDALREADRRKDEFLAVLAHELRNPLAPVVSSLELIERADNNPALVADARATMQVQIELMVRLIDDLLDVSRITRNRLELRKDRIELAPVIRQAVEACRPLAEEANLQLDVALPAEPIVVDADAMRLAQVFGNLLTNACKYTRPGGQVRLIAERSPQSPTSPGGDEGEVVITVMDTGVGIPRDMLPRVFDMFTQIDRSLERSQGGLGIGLSLAKRLVEMHDGTVTAHSEGPGRGSTFVVRLPAARSISKPSAKSCWASRRRDACSASDKRD